MFIEKFDEIGSKCWRRVKNVYRAAVYLGPFVFDITYSVGTFETVLFSGCGLP